MKILKQIVLTLFILFLLAVFTVLYARFIEPNMLTINRKTFQSDIKIEPFRIVFFSDTHFGRYYDEKKIDKIVSEINAQKPDIVVFGGDFFDAYNKDASMLDTDYLQQQLQKIEAEMVKVAIWGNHDYGGGSVRIYQEFMEGGGFTVLKDNVMEFQDYNIDILGLDDYLLGTPTNSTEFLNTDRFNIVLSHAPDIVDRIDLGPVNLALSGHSHGGQVSIPFVSKYVRPTGALNYTKGIYNFDTARNSKLFVTKGLGTTKLPLRFMSVPEIAVIDVAYTP